jgi:hypothetical protein
MEKVGHIVENNQISCSRLNDVTQIDVYPITRLGPDESGVPVIKSSLAMVCHSRDRCGIKSALEADKYLWHLCPANAIFVEKGTFRN